MSSFKKTSKNYRKLARKAKAAFAGVKDKDLSRGLIYLTKAIGKLEKELGIIYKKVK